MLEVSDHLTALLLSALLPLVGLWRFRRLQRAIAEGRFPVRIRVYVQTIVTQWIVLVITLWFWTGHGRTLAELGVSISIDMRFAIGAGLCLLLVLFFVFQARMIRNSPELHPRIRATTSNIAVIAPTNASELGLFSVVAITAGVCEEMLYRGFLLWYLSVSLGIVAAVFVGAIIFGIGHAYQGLKGILKTGGMGLVTGGLFVLMRSVVGVVVIHAVIDITSGFVLYWIRERPVDNEAQPKPVRD